MVERVVPTLAKFWPHAHGCPLIAPANLISTGWLDENEPSELQAAINAEAVNAKRACSFMKFPYLK
jgi:hypothetical protein